MTRLGEFGAADQRMSSVTKLADLAPEWFLKMPAPRRPEEIPGLRRILTSGRVGRYRAADYVCGKSHRLAEVLCAPEPILVVHGLTQEVLPPFESPADPDDLTAKFHAVADALDNAPPTYVYRARTWALTVADLAKWDELTSTSKFMSALEFEPRCRCGQRLLPARRVADDMTARRRRITLTKSRTAL